MGNAAGLFAKVWKHVRSELLTGCHPLELDDGDAPDESEVHTEIGTTAVALLFGPDNHLVASTV